MYLYQPCLLSMALYAWAFDRSEAKGRWLRILFPLMILALSELEFTFVRVSLYPAVLILPTICFFEKSRSPDRIGVLTAALLGGFLCWKAADLWPLLPARPLLCASLSALTACSICRSRNERRLACALAGSFYELFFCLREYTLFSFCVIRLGSRDALSLSAAALCLCLLWERLPIVRFSKNKRTVSAGN